MSNKNKDEPESLDIEKNEAVEPRKEEAEQEVERNEVAELRSDVDKISEELKTASWSQITGFGEARGNVPCRKT